MQFRRKTLFDLTLFALLYLGCLVTFGSLRSVLALGLLLIVGLLLVRQMFQARTVWSCLAGLWAVQPILLTLAFLVWLPFRFRDYVLLEFLVHGLYLATLAASGPLGLIVTVYLEWNFPYDQDWLYLFALGCATLAQWAGIWFVGEWYLSRERSAGLTRIIAGSGIAVAILFVISFFLHIGVYVARHS